MFTVVCEMLTKKNKEIVLATRVTPDVQKTVEQIAAALGLKPSEYLRRLILDDFEKRSITTSQIELLKSKLKKQKHEDLQFA